MPDLAHPLDDTKRRQADATVEGAAIDVAVAILAREAELKAHDGQLIEAATLLEAARILQERYVRVQPLMVQPR